MKKILMLLLIVVSPLVVKAQRVGYELRTNGNTYFYTDFHNFELRHRTDLEENRVTYRQNIKIDKHFVMSVPLHYKIEKHQPTLEPRLVYKWDNKAIWVQQEFDANKLYNLALAIDFKDGNRYYRLGWDNSNTYRFRLLINIG